MHATASAAGGTPAEALPRSPGEVPDWRERLPEVLATLRIGLGVSLMVVPSLAARPYLGSEAGRPAMRFVNRVFGVRDVALGMAVLNARRSGDGAALSRALWTSVACDAFDAAAALRGRELSPWGRLLVGVTALSAVGLGAAAAVSSPPS
jgi:hypothetical protein